MRKHFISIVLSLIIVLFVYKSNSITLVSAYLVPFDENTSYTYNDLNTINELIAKQESYMSAAHQMAESARYLGYTEDHQIILLAKEEYNKAEQEKLKYQIVYDDLIAHWQEKEREYPVASYIWKYLKNLGYNDQICAGILGNIMAEAGGNSLNINPEASTPYYFGICQWNNTTHLDVWGLQLEGQCNYLKDTIKYEINIFGHAYKKNFNYEDFLNLTDIEEAALAFARSYERCASGSYKIRQKNAIIAYNYFIS